LHHAASHFRIVVLLAQVLTELSRVTAEVAALRREKLAAVSDEKSLAGASVRGCARICVYVPYDYTRA
jgi:hypothetical protein